MKEKAPNSTSAFLPILCIVDEGWQGGRSKEMDETCFKLSKCRHNIGKNAEVEFGAFSFLTSPLMKCSKSYFMASHEYMDLPRA